MFGVETPELMVCFVVALVVLGPQKLPKIARAIGRVAGRTKGYLRNLSAELEREQEIGALRRQLEDVHRAVAEEASKLKASTEGNPNRFK